MSTEHSSKHIQHCYEKGKISFMENQIVQLKKQMRYMQIGLVSCLAVIGLLFISGFTNSNSRTFDIIRAKGIVIEDETGKDRILIGAPLPTSKDRVLSNQDKFEASFGKYDPKNKWSAPYKDLRTTANGMIVLDKDGNDIVVFGEDLPVVNGGKRIGIKTDGFMLNGLKGRERGGFGVITKEDGSQQVGLGLDTPKNEGVILAVNDGLTAVLINDGKNKIGFGNFAPKTWWNYTDKPLSGYIFLDEKYNVKHQFNALEEPGKPK